LNLTLIHPRSIAGERVAARANENAEADRQKESTLHPYTSYGLGKFDIPGGIGATPGAITAEIASATRIFPPKKDATEGKLRSRFWVARPGSTKTLLISLLTGGLDDTEGGPASG
jgi:hypothetical protein